MLFPAAYTRFAKLGGWLPSVVSATATSRVWKMGDSESLASAASTAPAIECQIEPGAEQIREQLLRILKSKTFQNGPMLRKLLEFVVVNSIDGKAENLNEYAIATGVLGRRGDFDPSSDTSVRTHAYRLRTKLRDYYSDEGKADSLLIDMPKGHYRPAFSTQPERRPESGAVGVHDVPASAGVSVDTDIEDQDSVRVRMPRWLVLSSVALLGVAIFLGGALTGRYYASENARLAATSKVDGLLTRFWRAPSADDGVVLTYSNQVFLETNSGDLLSYRQQAVADRGSLAGKDDAEATAKRSGLDNHGGPLYYESAYTGTGEVVSVYRITDLLRSISVNFIVKRSGVLSETDFRNHDVVFLGSVYVNKLLNQISLPKRFTFELIPSASSPWDSEIVDNEAGPSSSRSYRVEYSPQTHAILVDYALFEVFPGPTPNHRVVLLAGLSTTGTQGAATFATSSEGLKQVRDMLGATPGKDGVLPAEFACLLRIHVVDGLDAMDANLVSCSK
jgi:hypothetical protein